MQTGHSVVGVSVVDCSGRSEFGAALSGSAARISTTTGAFFRRCSSLWSSSVNRLTIAATIDGTTTALMAAMLQRCLVLSVVFFRRKIIRRF